MSNEYISNFFTDSYTDIVDKTKRLANKAVEAMVSQKSVEAEKLYDAVKCIRYSAQGYMEQMEKDTKTPDEMKAKTLVQVTYNLAILDMLQLYNEKMHIVREIEKIGHSYRDIMLHVVSNCGPITKSDLQKKMGFTENKLDRIVEELNSSDVKLFYIEKLKGTSLYSLTPVAHEYMHYRFG